jgi:hypothetical protein
MDQLNGRDSVCPLGTKLRHVLAEDATGAQMELQTSPQAKLQASAAQPANPGKYRPVVQPVDVINVPGALLKIETLAQLSGESVSSLYRAAKKGELTFTKKGARCTRVSSENARAYLARIAGEVVA